jgi:uncharacterized membrane protein
MTLPEALAPFSTLDLAALGLLAAAWALIGWAIEHPPRWRPSVTALMADYRRDWMRQFVTRQPRIFDANVIDSLRQGTAFFASACMIAIGGGVALMGNPAGLRMVTEDLAPVAVAAGVELRLLPVLLFLANALLKFIWAHAAEVNITAARSFNRGLRSVYFALGALAWLLGPYALMLATALSVGVLARREFASTSREVILGQEPG